jgi:hypothetical protein
MVKKLMKIEEVAIKYRNSSRNLTVKGLTKVVA